MANQIIKEGRVRLQESTGIWNVQTTAGITHAVQLFKSDQKAVHCTCPALGLCAHKLAAMKSINYVFKVKKHENVALMRQAALKKPLKSKGAKRPTLLEKDDDRAPANKKVNVRKNS